MLISRFLLSNRDVALLGHMLLEVALWEVDKASWMQYRLVLPAALLPTCLLFEADVVVFLQVACHMKAALRFSFPLLNVTIPALM